jgi:peptidyl-prolyl cis-trans isomerase SurA
MKLTNHILSTLILVSTISQTTIAAPIQIDKIEAVVNQELILNSDIAKMKRDLIIRAKENNQILPADEELNKQILDKLITDSLQLQIANTIGLRINDVQVDQTIEEIAKKQNKTVSQMRTDLENSGTNYDAFVDGIRDELTINEVRQMQVNKRMNISDQEVEQMVERLNQQGQQTTEFNFTHILLKTSSTMSAEEKLAIDKKANYLIDKINQGADINELALTYSEGPKASEGGDWGWRKIDDIPSMLVSHFDENIKKGDVIGPFNTNLGVHIIKIIDKKGNESVLSDEVNTRHILIKPNIILNDEKAKQLLTSLRSEIVDGSKTFTDLAKKYSQDPGSAIKGGELGWADPNVYVPEFRDAALSQKIGEISQPFHTTHGWHILEVLDRRKSDVTEKATKQKAYSILFRQRFPAEAYAWLNEIRQEAYIKINNPDYVVEEE